MINAFYFSLFYPWMLLSLFNVIVRERERERERERGGGEGSKRVAKNVTGRNYMDMVVREVRTWP